jgi:hypothetical protein
MDQARKALYCLHRKLRNISIPIDLQLKLFDTLILPILTEIWGYENTKQLEKIVSSAYSKEKSFTNIFKFSEHTFLIFSKSFTLFSTKNCSMSFR